MSRSGTLIRGAASSLAIGALAFGSALALGTAANAEPGDVTLTVSQESGLENGQTVSVTGAGLDPAAGYYLSTCVIGTDGPTGPDCAGGPSDQSASVWVSNDPSATAVINPDGTFTADLTATQTGLSMTKTAIDCDVTPCAVTLFADHRNGFGYVTGTPVSFGAAASPSTAATEVVTEEVTSEDVVAESDDESSNTVWWIVGGVIVVAVIAGGAVAYTKKS